MALKLRIGNLHRKHRRQALADVLAGQVGIGILTLAPLLGKGVEGAGEHRLQALNVGAAIDGANVISEAKDVVGIGIHAPLQGSLNLHPITLGVDIDNLRVQRILLRIHVGHVFLDATLVVVDLLVGLASRIAGAGPLITEDDPHATIEVGQLAQPRREGVIVELDAGAEDLDIGLESHLGARATHFGGGLGDQAADWRTPLKALVMHLVLAVDRDLHPLGEGVDHGHPHTVKPAGDLIASGAELTAGV